MTSIGMHSAGKPALGARLWAEVTKVDHGK
jgi:hypothetical protein